MDTKKNREIRSLYKAQWCINYTTYIKYNNTNTPKFFYKKKFTSKIYFLLNLKYLSVVISPLKYRLNVKFI